MFVFFFFSSRRRHTSFDCDWSSDVCSSDLAQVVNAVNRNPASRALLEKAIGVHPERRLPPYNPGTFRGQAAASRSHEPRNGERTTGKVAVFSTCYVNYNEPGIGHDLL